MIRADYALMLVDRYVIESTLGLPRHSVLAVERRHDATYAILLDRKRIDYHHRRTGYRDLRALQGIGGRRVLRIPRRTVHGRSRRWRSRNRRLLWWALENLPYSPAAEPERIERGDRVLDELRAAIVRESHRGTMRQGWRDAQRRLWGDVEGRRAA